LTSAAYRVSWAPNYSHDSRPRTTAKKPYTSLACFEVVADQIPADRQQRLPGDPTQAAQPGEQGGSGQADREDQQQGQLQLGAQDGEFGQGRVQHLLFQGRVAAEEVAEQGDQDQQQRQEGEEAVVGHQGGEVAALVVAELLRYREGDADPGVLLLVAEANTSQASGGPSNPCLGAVPGSTRSDSTYPVGLILEDGVIASIPWLVRASGVGALQPDSATQGSMSVCRAVLCMALVTPAAQPPGTWSWARRRGVTDG
jgi:hypothetical protein